MKLYNLFFFTTEAVSPTFSNTTQPKSEQTIIKYKNITIASNTNIIVIESRTARVHQPPSLQLDTTGTTTATTTSTTTTATTSTAAASTCRQG